MARFSPNYDFYQQSPSTLDTKPVFPDDDEASVLDDKILDPTTPDVSILNDPRRPSYDPHPDDVSRNSMFPEYNPNSQPRPVQLHSNPLFDVANTGFVRMDAPQTVQYAQHSSAWPIEGGSGACTPTPGYDGYAQEYEVGGPVTFSNTPMGSMNPMSFSSIPYRPGASNFPPPGAVAMSPQSSQGWMSAASSEAPDSRSLPKRSPTYRPTSPLQSRRDGIRKKNARFEIPAERTLSNIDFLINQSTDDQEIKELKQQKRLLRNRQAALDSRQRKKQHTEKLEEEKKHYTTVITELEDALEQMKSREAEHQRELAELHAQQQNYEQYIESLIVDRDEMLRNHTLETAELRKKNTFLAEHIQKLESTSIPVQSSAGYSGDFPDFENLTMGNSSWDDFSLGQDYPMENTDNRMQPPPPPPAPPAHTETLVLETPKKSDRSMIVDGSLGFSWNAFYMCLLFGAFIASNSGSTLPHLSDEYRAESANVLKAVLSSSPSDGAQSQLVAHQSQPQPQPATITSAEMARITSGPGSSSLDTFHASLVAPSKQQESEQLFSLSAGQYNTLTSLDEDQDELDDGHPPQMTNLQAALAAARQSGEGASATQGKAEVYTRSLLWDRVPEKVVRDFRAMVKECGASEQQN